MMKKVFLLVATIAGLFLLAGAANLACEAPDMIEGLKACTAQIVAGGVLLLPGLYKVVVNR